MNKLHRENTKAEYYAYNKKKKQWVAWIDKNKDCLNDRTLVKIGTKAIVWYKK